MVYEYIFYEYIFYEYIFYEYIFYACEDDDTCFANSSVSILIS